jgi:aspartyl-tRNA(Asn)/glutamyl-tRNA(Gln) amidotransferase subunit A
MRGFGGGCAALTREEPDSLSSDLDTRSASLQTIAAALRDGTFSAVDLTEQAIAAHDRYGKTLAAYAHWAPELAREMAMAADKASPQVHLQGLSKASHVPVRTSAVSGACRRSPAKWDQEGPVTAGLRRQLAVVTGKTHMVSMRAQ